MYVFFSLGQTCNHIAALLFKLDYAWQTGLTNKTCTSKAATWTAPASTKKLEPKKISGIDWAKPKYKTSGLNKKPSKANTSNGADTFQPPTLEDMMGKLYVDSKEGGVWDYCLYDKNTEMSPADDLNVEGITECVTTAAIPDPLPALIHRYGRDLPCFTADEVAAINSGTIGQADNLQWAAQRVGRVTGSTIHAAHTAAQKIKQQKDVAHSTINSVMGTAKDISGMAAIKYGRQNESVAMKEYVQVMERRGHHVEVEPAGLVVSATKIYIGASPDGIVSCSCCG